MNAEDRIVAALIAEAAIAPPVGDLLVRVSRRARQRARRRFVAAAAMSIVALTAGAATVSALGHTGAGILAPTEPFARQGESAGDPLVEGSAPPLRFPYSPGWLPDGVARNAQLSLGDSGLQASWSDATPGEDGLLPAVDLWSSDRDVSLRGDGVTRRETTFAGHAAVLASTQGQIALGWQATPGSWRVVVVFNRFASEATARRVAESLVEQPVEGTSPYTMTLLPRDMVLVRWTTYGWYTFAARDQISTWHDAAAPDVVRLAARRPTSAIVGHGEPVTVQEHHAWLTNDGQHGWTVAVEVSPQTVIVIEAPAWDRADVLRFAQATRYTGGVPPQEG